MGGIRKDEAEELHDFATLVSLLIPTRLSLYESSHWQYDVKYGNQMLNGVDPYIIKKCTKLLPANCYKLPVFRYYGINGFIRCKIYHC